MLEKMSEAQYKRIVENNRGLALDGLFASFQVCFGDIQDKPEIKEMFLELMADLMKTGELKLATKGKFLEGSIEEQIDVFRQAWPDHYDDKELEYDIDNIWWHVYAPAGAVWIWEDGYEDWT
ncbi:DUF596 domain-containing protein [Pasteurella multocida]|uniref:DUF596 domain-containing protein n=1 Tax=Pasteurella multocida TaxID=747 RepID=UPI000BBCF905|nr:DUF596 domain-containing protein [Pasteurella multocida]ATF75041.1 hypothetical protein CO688_06405 [Pasteurella multocida]ATN17443.1 DUF596 domain-containing protein [Pasteurella multocida]